MIFSEGYHRISFETISARFIVRRFQRILDTKGLKIFRNHFFLHSVYHPYEPADGCFQESTNPEALVTRWVLPVAFDHATIKITLVTDGSLVLEATLSPLVEEYHSSDTSKLQQDAVFSIEITSVFDGRTYHGVTIEIIPTICTHTNQISTSNEGRGLSNLFSEKKCIFLFDE